MEWTIPDQITVGTVIFMALYIVRTSLNQKTDPKFFELFAMQNKSDAEQNERLAKSLDRNTELLDKMEKVLNSINAGMDNTFNSLIDAIKAITSVMSTEHEQHATAIDSIPERILPTVREITQQLETQKGDVDKMVSTMDTQNGAINQILEAIKRIEKQLDTISEEVTTFKTKVESNVDSVQRQVETVKSDVQRLTTETKKVETIETETTETKEK